MLGFAEWLKEMTSTSSVSGGGTFTNDVARFSRRLFEFPVERGVKKKRKMHENDFPTTGSPGINPAMQPNTQQQQRPVQPQQPQPAQQRTQPLKGQGFSFGGTGTSQQLYNQGVNAFSQLAKRQPKFANAIKGALQQLQKAFVDAARAKQQGATTNDDDELMNAMNDPAMRDFMGSFGK